MNAFDKIMITKKIGGSSNNNMDYACYYEKLIIENKE